ncbi:hypothetical protein MMC27_004813 [Xylographa pallens]|nr:hypothetical protein [Xylographa pallens]
MDIFQLQSSGGDDFPSLDLTMQESLLDELVAFDGLLGLEDHISAQHQVFADVSVVPCDDSGHQPRSWCTWMQPGAALSIMTENPMMRQNANLIQVLQVEHPHAQHSADLIIQALRTLPMMMLRRETFPWFIHPHAHFSSKTSKSTLPEALSTCMSVAHMFASRTSETKPFIWRTIKAEHRRSTMEMHHMSRYELLAAAQACMIYLIMFLVEYSPELEEDGKELLQSLHASPTSCPASVAEVSRIYALSSRRRVDLLVRANLPNQAPIGNIGSMPNPAKGSQLCGSSSAALCLRKPAVPAVLYKAIVVSCFLAQNPSGRHPRSLVGSRSTKLAAFFKQVS